MTRNRMRGKREEEEREQRERAAVPSCRAGSREEDAPCARREREMTRNRMRGKREKEERESGCASRCRHAVPKAQRKAPRVPDAREAAVLEAGGARGGRCRGQGEARCRGPPDTAHSAGWVGG
jgi:hypothetical protein